MSTDSQQKKIQIKVLVQDSVLFFFFSKTGEKRIRVIKTRGNEQPVIFPI